MPGRNLKLLCLDGGGIRGLSALFILQKLMETINPGQPPKPCEYFDIIGGTSTGGLIAILLGRLEMDVDNCIKWYIDLCAGIFANKKVLPFDLKGNVQARFKTEPLKKAIIKVIGHQGFREDELLQKPENRCKVFVCATSGNTSTPVLFRSYPSARDSSSLYRETEIWEAARATSAAPTFFEPICIGSTGRPFGDGGTGANNPIDEMWKEAIDICEGEPLTDNLGCIVSIGTGVPNLKKFGHSGKGCIESIVRIATQTEETANNFHHAHPELNTGQQRYFRFNAPRGLGEIELDEASEAGTIEDITAYYLRDENTHKQVQQCAKLIAETNLGSFSREGGLIILSARISIPAADLTSPLIFSNVVKRPEWQMILSKSHTSLHDIFDRLSNYDRYKAYRRRAKNKFENTTQWILRHPDFVTWLSGEGPQCLWLTGIVGCGKSIVMTTVIDAANAQAQKEIRPVLYFIYDHSFRNYLTAKSLFESCTKQLLGYLERSNISCPSAVVSRIQEFYSPKSRRPDIQELVDEIMIPLYDLVKSVTFLVDGLDECSRQERLDVLMVFRQLLKYPSCRVFISCREEVNVLRGVPGSIRVWISCGHTKADMEIFLDKQIEMRQYERPLSDNQAVIDHIKNELLCKADGMFLWVQYQVKMLWEDCVGEDAVDETIYKALEKLPKDLNETYQRCLSRVKRDNKRKHIADRVLKWICATTEPFRISQLQEALVVNLETGEIEHSPVQKEEVIACCANLAFLEKDGPDELVLPAHHSVRQFLFPPTAESALENAEKELGELCVVHLYKHRPLRQLSKTYTQSPCDPHRTTLQLQGNIVSTIGSSILPTIFRRQPHQTSVSIQLPLPYSQNSFVPGEKGFLSYAIKNWALLTRNISTTSLYWMQFEGLALLNSQTWDIYPWGPSRPSWDSHIFELYAWSIINRHYSLLSLAMDQQTRVKRLIFELPLFDQVGEQILLPLHAAVDTGDVRIVKLLLEISAGGGNQAVLDATRMTLLHRAAGKGHEVVVRLLLDYKANIEAKSVSGLTPLHCAASEGHEAAIRLLLDYKANIEAKRNNGWTPLHCAASRDHEAAIRLLLDYKANTEAKDNFGWTPLHCAASRGHEAAIRLLLDYKANIEVKDDSGWTPLHCAASGGYEASIRVLLENKADIGATDNKGRAPLSYADANGRKLIKSARSRYQR